MKVSKRPSTDAKSRFRASLADRFRINQSRAKTYSNRVIGMAGYPNPDFLQPLYAASVLMGIHIRTLNVVGDVIYCVRGSR